MWNQLCQSKYCEQIENVKSHRKYVTTMSNVKPEVDCQEPFMPSFFKQNDLKHRKRDRQFGEKVSYENQLLRSKMMGIDQRKKSALSQQLEQFRTAYASSKIQSRLRETNKINSENLGIQKRLMITGSMYSVKQFESDNLKHQYLASNISKNARRIKSISQDTKNPKKQTPSHSVQPSLPQDIVLNYQILENSLAQRNANLTLSKSPREYKNNNNNSTNALFSPHSQRFPSMTSRSNLSRA